MKTKPGRKEHEAWVLWAALCAGHVLPYFEKERPKDNRPRKAIEEARRWVREGAPMKMAVIRKASLDAHAAARATGNPAARAAGQAVATVHVVTHAPGAAYYGLKAVGPKGAAAEKKWQQKHLPKHLRRNCSLPNPRKC